MVHISKLDAAKRQMESGVRLFFVSGDPVATHTLTGAARSLLGDLARAEGRTAGLEEMFQAQVRPERLGEVRGLMVQAQNFFKHADRDPDEVLDFNPNTTEYLLWDACVLYEALTGHRHAPFLVFQAWFALAHPRILLPEVQQEVIRLARTFDIRDRPGFYREFLPLAEELQAG